MGSVLFFSKEELKAQIARVVVALIDVEIRNEHSRFVIDSVKTILTAMKGNGETFDKYCQFNVEWIGDSFRTAISGFSSGKDDTYSKLHDIFSMAYRFLCELDLMMPGDLNFDLRKIRSSVGGYIDGFADEFKSQIVYANYVMPSNVLKRLLHDECILDVKRLNENIASLTATKDSWIKELDDRRDEVDKLKDALSRYKTAFNFVGLYDGFSGLRDQKLAEKNRLLVLLFVFGVMALIPLFGELWFIYNMAGAGGSSNGVVLYMLPGVAAIEVLIVYFFRIVLFNFKSVNAQLLQVDLRMTLCQFVQNYAEYAKEIKSKESGVLEKFEK